MDVGCVKDLTRNRVLVYVPLRRRTNTSKIRISSFAINKLLSQGFYLQCSVSYYIPKKCADDRECKRDVLWLSSCLYLHFTWLMLTYTYNRGTVIGTCNREFSIHILAMRPPHQTNSVMIPSAGNNLNIHKLLKEQGRIHAWQIISGILPNIIVGYSVFAVKDSFFRYVREKMIPTRPSTSSVDQKLSIGQFLTFLRYV